MVYTQCSSENVTSGISKPSNTCGDNCFSQEIFPPSIPFESMLVKSLEMDSLNYLDSSHYSDSLNFPENSNFLSTTKFLATKTCLKHTLHSQSTQTNSQILRKIAQSQGWLVRRTRSGLIYGKYPL